ncbi:MULTISPECIES: hypothetical protein [unclassified Curtobacterium]|uniref:hypothetical protein n=1 Tax=unclassified Curtobacterium TaxID=257496 RepID=UPI0008DCA5BF|nr:MULTISPECIES: hypothetical protein [unclassified Curtobacterium]OIH95768.1 hypothetical protein BIU92_04525 [Curtobacterium sp. MCBA15_003]OII31338.1 hypothetical protein BIU94_05080 [Curtobacterium sp. MMLR14_006]
MSRAPHRATVATSSAGAGRASAGTASGAVWREALGALVALALAVVALRHVVATERVSVLWYDGDSVLLPLVRRSLEAGQPFEWAMSPALFFFPELPVYLLCALVTATPQQALALNGVLVLLAVYALVRAAANELMPSAGRAARITVSAGALAFVTLLVLTESSPTTNSLELASLLLTTTYYYGVVLAMLGTAVLVLRAVRTGRASPTVLVVLGLVAACTTASNPMYVPWSAAPVVVTLALLALARRVPWRPAGLLGATLVVGSVVGYLLRVPLRPFVSLDPSSYLHPDRAAASLRFFAALTDDRAGTAAGDAGLLLLFAGVLVAVGGTVWAWRVRTSRTVLVATALPLVTVVALSVGVVVTGQDAARYLQPIATVPLLALVAVAELARTAVRRTRVHRPRRGLATAVAVAAGAVLVTGVAVTPSTAGAVAAARYGPTACLERWADGRTVTGVGQFWTVRPLAAYATPNVHLLQVRDTFDAYPWLVDLGAYRDASPTFVIVGSRDLWTTAVEDSLGAPATITHCTGFDVYDYAGTAGAEVLRRDVVGSADAIRRERGF